jgi:hypothetical protein
MWSISAVANLSFDRDAWLYYQLKRLPITEYKPTLGEARRVGAELLNMTLTCPNSRRTVFAKVLPPSLVVPCWSKEKKDRLLVRWFQLLLLPSEQIKRFQSKCGRTTWFFQERTHACTHASVR